MDRVESQLIEKCQRGDVRAFDELVRRYERQVYNFAFKMTANREDAYDVAQDALVRVYHFIDTFKAQSSFTTWLYRIVLNAYLDSRKKSKIRDQSVSLDEYLEQEDGYGPKQVADEDTPAPEELVLATERTEVLHAAIGLLPDYQRAMIVFYHVNHMSYEEIAEILSLPIGTVKSRLNRARQALKEKLSESKELFS